MTQEELEIFTANLRKKYGVSVNEFNTMLNFPTEKETTDYLDSFGGDKTGGMYRCYNEFAKVYNGIEEATPRYISKHWYENGYGLEEDDVYKIYNIIEKTKGDEEAIEKEIISSYPQEKQSGANRLFKDIFAQELFDKPGAYSANDLLNDNDLTSFELNEFITATEKGLTPNEIFEMFGDDTIVLAKAYDEARKSEASTKLQERKVAEYEKTEDGIHILDNHIFEEIGNWLWDITDVWANFINSMCDGEIDFDLAKEVKSSPGKVKEKLSKFWLKDGSIDGSLMSFCNDFCNLWIGFHQYATIIGKMYDYETLEEKQEGVSDYLCDFVNETYHSLAYDITLKKGNTFSKDDLLDVLGFFTTIYDVIGDNYHRIGVIKDVSAWKELLKDNSLTVQQKIEKCENIINERYHDTQFIMITKQFLSMADAYNKVIKIFSEVYGLEDASDRIGDWNNWTEENKIEGFDVILNKGIVRM